MSADGGDKMQLGLGIGKLQDKKGKEKKKDRRQRDRVLSVAEFVEELNAILTPKQAIVLGEVSQVSSRNSYTFFYLKDKDKEVSLNCFVWQRRLESLGIDLRKGMELKVSGFPKIYPRTGSLTFEVEGIGLIGEGDSKIAFEKLKARLESKGYFAPERKRPLPPFVDCIGLITSRYADAKTDFLEHLGNFGLQIYFADVRVEGSRAVKNIVQAIKFFNENVSEVDVLVVTRGGGNLESLQAFNSEDVARAVYGSKIPVLTGIGHEADQTITDLVADVRASTPTHAARILSDPWKLAVREIKTIRGEMLVNLQKSVANRQEKIEKIGLDILTTFRKAQNERQQNLDNLTGDLATSFGKQLETIKKLFQEQKEKLELASPLNRLRQGYSIVKLGDSVVHSVRQLSVNDILKIKLFEGMAVSQVKEVRSDGE